jgi:hypothetical protein
MVSSADRSRHDPARQRHDDGDTAAGMTPRREVSPEKAAEIARNLQQVFTRIGQQPVPERLQAIIDRMAEEERRNE